MKKSTRVKKNKSGKAICDICKESCFLEIHHIFGRKVANFNFNWNLVDICPNCHTKVHQGKIKILGWENTTTGRILNYILI